jgi:hypothetical protein
MRSRPLFFLCLILAPAVLLGIELFHPANFTEPPPGMYEYLSKPEAYDPRYVALAYPGPDWWFVLHMIQTPLVGLVGVGIWLVVGRVERGDGVFAVALAWLSRAATFIFIIYYTALDAIGGFGLARAMLNTEALAAKGELKPDQVDGIRHLLDVNWQDRWVGGVGSFTSLLGSWSVFVAALSGAIALVLSRRIGWLPLIVFVAFGWEPQVSHASPHGPIAFGLLIIFAVWAWLADRARRPAP